VHNSTFAICRIARFLLEKNAETEEKKLRFSENLEKQAFQHIKSQRAKLAQGLR
jgi:hypothetical protein